MNTLLILLVQTKSGATIEIISFLLVAAIIGYVTAWLYYKSVYVRRIKVIESEKDEALVHIAQRKHLLDYKSYGTATEAEKDDLKMISGIGGWIKEKLNVLDIYTFKQISNFNSEDVAAVTEAIEYFPGRIERDEWILQAKELVRIAGDKSELLKRIRDRQDRIYFDRLGIAQKHEANNLTLIDGLGLWVEERLNLLGIYTFDQISKLTHKDIETITEVLEIIPGRIEQDNWVGQSRELAKSYVQLA